MEITFWTKSNNLINISKQNKGARILLYKVLKPESFGVAKINLKNKVTHIKGKPKVLFNLAITGLYFFDNNVSNYSKKLKPSNRGELEIVDLLNIYRKKNKLTADFLGRGGAW